MTQHWWFVSAAWGLAALLFAVLLLTTFQRQASARRRLAALEAGRTNRRQRAAGAIERMPGRGAAALGGSDEA